MYVAAPQRGLLDTPIRRGKRRPFALVWLPDCRCPIMTPMQAGPSQLDFNLTASAATIGLRPATGQKLKPVTCSDNHRDRFRDQYIYCTSTRMTHPRLRTRRIAVMDPTTPPRTTLALPQSTPIKVDSLPYPLSLLHKNIGIQPPTTLPGTKVSDPDGQPAQLSSLTGGRRTLGSNFTSRVRRCQGLSDSGIREVTVEKTIGSNKLCTCI